MKTPSNWYAVSGSSDLPSGCTRAVMLEGEDIVIWRTTSGVAQAWHNRCIHRGMRLSFGQVRGEQLSCRYHGWLFNKAGECTRMPAQPALKPAASLCVPGYACEERRGLIWVNLNGESSSSLDSALNSHETEDHWIFFKSLYLGINSTAVLNQLETVNFPVFNGNKKTRCDSKSVFHPPNTVTATVVNGDVTDMISLTIHPISPSRTAIHLCTVSTGDLIQDQVKRLHYHQWAQRLRWFFKTLLHNMTEFIP